MAGSFFGEIVEPASRAINDFGEEDFEEETATATDFALSWKSGQPQCNLLIIIHGAIAKAFAEHNFLSTDKFCGTVKKIDKSTEVPGAAKFYLLENQTLCCLVTDVEDYNAVSFVESVSQTILTASKVVIICSKPAAQFLGERKFEEGVLMCLTAFAKTEEMLGVSCSIVAQPNFVSGVPASVMTFCQLEKKGVCLFVCYSDDDPYAIDSRTLAPFDLLLSSPLLKPLCKNGHKAKLSNASLGNIYM